MSGNAIFQYFVHLARILWFLMLAMSGAHILRCTKGVDVIVRSLWQKIDKGECPTSWHELKSFFPNLDIRNRENDPLLHVLAEKEMYNCLEEALREGADITVRSKDGRTLLFRAAEKDQLPLLEILVQYGYPIREINEENKNATEVAADKASWRVAERLVQLGVPHRGASRWLYQAILQNDLEKGSMALKLGASPISAVTKDRNPLMLGAELGRLAFVKLMVQRNINVNETPLPQITATTLAFAKNHLDIARLLMDKGGYDPQANPLLFQAIDEDSPEKIALAQARGANPQAVKEGLPALHYAYIKGKNQALNKLIEISPDLNQQDASGQTLLFLATRKEDVPFIKRLLEKKADPNIANSLGYTPLIWASAEGYEEVVELLLGSGADVHREIHKGGSAVYWARERGHERIVKLLLKAGAIDPDNFLALIEGVRSSDVQKTRQALAARVNVNARNKDGYSAIMFAAHQPNVEIVDMLIKAGAEINVQEDEGYTPLMIACWNNYYEIAERLLKAGADTKLRHKTGRSALMIATWKGSVELVRLLAQRSDINAQDNEGWTALMFAASEGNVEKVKALLSYGASKALKNKAGKTAKDIALGKGYEELAKLL
ncbi:MAG: ankyrin repeat domain-containing protein [Leptospiraceae bacterium]|nr:ankyrin repeat domain-containing protein [Leptospiraceae bacterium]MDW8307486.1 ankyrin repeat domain-containing protein [Leptospiraceae bacterium]